MVSLADFSGYLFARRLDVVHKAFLTSRIALDEFAAEQEDALAKYEGEAALGMDPIGQRDADGFVIWSEDQLLQMRIEDAREEFQTVHKAAVISAYHGWEDASRCFTKKSHKAQHLDLVRALADQGIAAHEAPRVDCPTRQYAEA